jgi:REP element-mobilizing transposase RayT
MGRGIEKVRIFKQDSDREDFVARLADLCRDGYIAVLAWALMPNHFHLLIRTGRQPIHKSMRKLLTGYVVNFNRRHKRFGHLFQNRYKSILCEEDPYLLELTRYIHLNPLRSGVVNSFEELNVYPWTGHSTLMGVVEADWQDTETVLGYFGRGMRESRKGYRQFMEAGVSQGRKPELVGGGLIRSLGGWSQVLSLRRRGGKIPSDERILGSGEFVEGVLSEISKREEETLRLRRKVVSLEELMRIIVAKENLTEKDLRSGDRRRGVVRGRRVFCQLAVRGMGYSGAEVARYLGVTASAVNRLSVSGKQVKLQEYLKSL